MGWKADGYPLWKDPPGSGLHASSVPPILLGFQAHLRSAGALPGRTGNARRPVSWRRQPREVIRAPAPRLITRPRSPCLSRSLAERNPAAEPAPAARDTQGRPEWPRAGGSPPRAECDRGRAERSRTSSAKERSKELAADRPRPRNDRSLTNPCGSAAPRSRVGGRRHLRDHVAALAARQSFGSNTVSPAART